MKELSEKQKEAYIKTFHELGSSFFCKAEDKQLREWGHSPETIKELRIKTVHDWIGLLSSEKRFIEILNKNLGGTNKI